MCLNTILTHSVVGGNNHLFFSPNRFAIISAWFLNRNCSSHKACAYHDAQSSSLPEQGSIIRFDLIKAQPFSNPSFSLSSLSLGICKSENYLVILRVKLWGLLKKILPHISLIVLLVFAITSVLQYHHHDCDGRIYIHLTTLDDIVIGNGGNAIEHCRHNHNYQ